MVRSKAILIVFVVSVLLVVTAAAFDVGKGRIRGFAFVTADNMVSTTSSVFEKVPDMTVAAKTEGPLIIRFCAACNTSGVGSMPVTVAVDGVNVPFGMEPEGGIQFAATQFSLPHCFTWVVTDLGPGVHTIDMLWRKGGGGTAYIQGRTLVVEGG